MYTKHTPINERILVKPIETPSVTKGGLLVPTVSKDNSQYGKIVDMGEGRLLDDGTRVPFTVKKGDLVLFSRRAGTEITIEGEMHRFLLERDILAVVEIDQAGVEEVPALPPMSMT